MRHLQQTASALHKVLDPSKFLDDATSQKALLDMTWQLGSASPAIASASEGALRVFCTCFLANSWAWTPDRHSRISGVSCESSTSQTGRKADSKQNHAFTVAEEAVTAKIQNISSIPSVDFTENVAEVLSRLFVYLFCKLVQEEWLQKSQGTKIHTIRVLQRVISLLRPTDLGSFLPKIMFAVESSLSHPAPQVQLAGAYLVQEVIARLPTQVLEENAALLVVGLYPLLELSLDNVQDNQEKMETETEKNIELEQEETHQHSHYLSEQRIAFLQHLVLKDLPLASKETEETGETGGGRGRKKYEDDAVEKVLAARKHNRLWQQGRGQGERSGEGGEGIDSICSVLLSHVRAAAKWHQRQAQSVAVRTLNTMFVEMGGSGRGGGLQRALRGLPFIPALPGLREVFRLHAIQQRQLTHVQMFRQVCGLLTHGKGDLINQLIYRSFQSRSARC